MAKKKTEDRPILYPCVSVAVCGTPEQTGASDDVAKGLANLLGGTGFETLISYNPPLTSVDMVTLLGVETETEEDKFGDDFLFTDRMGRKVRCKNNVRNRAVVMSGIEKYVQDILNARWELNGETFIVGRDGIVLNGQHQGIALYLAQQDCETVRDMDSQELRWAKQWPDGVVRMPKVIIYGIENSDRVVNTMDTCKPRSFSDVLYRSPFFQSLPKSDTVTHIDRNTAARVCEHAVMQVWLRTGMYLDSFSPRRTHAEGMVWLEQHGGMKGKFLRAVKEIMGQNTLTVEGDEGPQVTVGKITDHVSMGYAATALWLMGASGSDDSDEEAYYGAEDRSDKLLDWSLYPKAVEFWTAFGRDDGPLAALTRALGELVLTDEEGTRQAEKDYLIALAWNRFKDDKKIEKRNLVIQYSEPNSRTGARTLVNHPRFGGIDLGATKISKAPNEGREPPPDIREEVENGIEEERENGKLPVEPDPTEDKPLMEQMLAAFHHEHPDVGPVFTKSSVGNWMVWQIEAQMVGPLVGKTPRPHPTRLLYLSFKPDAVDEVVDIVTDAGHVVAFAEEQGGKLVVLKVCRPSKRRSK